ncbi:GUN4 domain-containing protein [Pleurocapsa sp. PCC 7319]|uniref:GUN4 domain-containing protein n=1 Tax=Pleurocapsa sp. PCC 7319 TaxID=118161 RepID=UPI0003481FE4|nr:GUN4 domain-containing protein [Pleurocapsa sp. PCC 7319]
MIFSHKFAIALSASVLLTGGQSIAQSNAASIDYSRLESLLAEGDWQEAHQETRDLMIQAGGAEEVGYLEDESVTNFPCLDLNAIDQLWSQYSNGKFGFNAQRQIWENMGGNPSSGDTALDKFAVQVGWKKEDAGRTEYLEYSELTFDPQTAVAGHLPALKFIPDIVDAEVPGSITSGSTSEFLQRVRTCSK